MKQVLENIGLRESEYNFPSGGFKPSLLKDFSIEEKAAYLRLYSQELANQDEFSDEVVEAIAEIVSENRKKDYEASLRH